MATRVFPFIFKSLGVKSISSGGTETWEWNADADYTIKYMFVIERGDLSLSKCLLTGKIEENYFTKDKVCAGVFGRDIRNAIELNYPLNKNQKISISIENQDTSDHEIEIVLVLVPRG